ncbi:cell division protein FtsQ [Motilibacter rhizosphaerae]|uniref:Cell division protein FtsQ n=1 Tax=Motilibacter rhizosphaerae TaxID=598652 RepID=A0A4Q7NGK2_9ACTN|nr:FtsQ-type POTRA domain-containing protein [Motilibacter rhizosphaerae]RZS82914.1 cell division protein FtsQ [Motilibacter rhizosphaerae]
MTARRTAVRPGRAGRRPGGATVRVARESSRPAPQPVRRPWLSRRALVALLGVVTVLVLAGWVALGTSALGVHTVEVRGTDRVPAAAVRAAVGVRAGFPLPRVDPAAAARRVRALPAVASATVTRVWPHTLRVQVVERQPVAVVQKGSGWSYVDAAGTAFAAAPATAGRSADVPVIRTRRGDTGALRSAAAVVAVLPGAVLAQLTSVDADSVDSVTLRLHGGSSVVWGSPEGSARKAQVLAVLMRSVSGGTVYDVSAPEAPTVRGAPAPTPTG